MRVVLLGSGNVATHLGKALQSAGHEILQVWSRNIEHAEELAGQLSSAPLSALDQLSREADIYIISVKDDAIAKLASSFPFTDRLLVHTSGSVGIDVFPSPLKKTGVFYPLQTFSRQREPHFASVPIALEANSSETLALLLQLAQSVSEKVVQFDSAKRKALHVAAVFASNFSNHLYLIAKQLLLQNGLDFELLRPLIAETAAKVQEFSPEDAQTGPALRQDKAVIDSHLQFLELQPKWQDLYEKLSQDIINFHQKR